MDLFERDFAGEREANASGAGRNGWRADGFHSESCGLKLRSDVESGFIGAEDYRNNLRGARAAGDARGGKFGAESCGESVEMGAAVVGGAGECEGGANLVRHVGRSRGGENEAARVVYKKSGERAAATDESADAGKSFSAWINGGEKAVVIRKFSGEAAALRAENAEGVGFVGDHIGVEFFGELENFGERRDVALHAKDAFRDDEFCAVGILIFAQGAFEKIQIAVRVDDFLRAREANAINDAGVIERVGKNEITRLQNGAEQADVGGVAGVEVESGFRARKSGEFRLEFLPVAGIPGEQARTGGRDLR